MANNVVSIGDNNTKSQRPSSSAFKQQKLPAWQPILTAGTVLPTFFLIGVAFIPIGIGLLVSSNQVQEYELNYTACLQWIRENDSYTDRSCAHVIANLSDSQLKLNTICECKLNFTLKEEIKKDVYIYYALKNYYQNHRRYVKSRDDRQLLGDKRGASNECDPYAKIGELVVAPCGAIANSLFNDTFRLETIGNKGKSESVPIMKTGIVWATDKKSKFRNPYVEAGHNLSEAFAGTVRPPNWRKDVWNLDSENKNNNGYENEQLIVWMRTAALPTFRKLYGRIGHDKHGLKSYFQQSLPKGNYSIIIQYNYPVASFKGTKHIIISNTSWLGGKNPFIGISYIIVGCVCLVLSGIFAFIHKKFGKSTSEMLNISQRTSYIG